MYSRELKQRFWTRFGQYMRPVPGADGIPVNWLNYKTGVKFIFFRLDVSETRATVSIELTHPDEEARQHYFERLSGFRESFDAFVGNDWLWEVSSRDEHDKTISKIGKSITGVSINHESDWPGIISFLKENIRALDAFWAEVKDFFEL